MIIFVRPKENKKIENFLKKNRNFFWKKKMKICFEKKNGKNFEKILKKCLKKFERFFGKNWKKKFEKILKFFQLHLVTHQELYVIAHINILHQSKYKGA